MEFQQIVNIISEKYPDAILSVHADVKQPFVEINGESLVEVCQLLHTNSELFFDHLACITGVDNDEKAGTIDVIYHLTSIPFGHDFILKVVVNRDLSTDPQVHTLTSIWKGADWHERELYDFFGVKFTNHPDLRRILLPANWEGHPLRKDYKEQEYYHGIKVEY